MNKPFTQNQTALGHVIEGVIVSIVVGVFTAASQYLASGQFSLSGLETALASAFLAAVVKGWATIRSTPSLAPAVDDTASQVNQALQAHHSSLIALLQPIAEQLGLLTRIVNASQKPLGANLPTQSAQTRNAPSQPVQESPVSSAIAQQPTVALQSQPTPVPQVAFPAPQVAAIPALSLPSKPQAQPESQVQTVGIDRNFSAVLPAVNPQQ